jgi:hypothetical protein
MELWCQRDLQFYIKGEYSCRALRDWSCVVDGVMDM